MKQSEIIKQLTNDQLRQQLFLSQGIFIFISLLSSFFLFNQIKDWFSLFKWDISLILLYGLLPAVILVVIEVIVSCFIDPRHIDDGGINERIFKDASVGMIFLIAFIVAIAEEMLFRGVIQTTFGYIFASSLFVIVHFRYLKKPLLLFSLVITSFFIGYIYLITENLLVTITFHFFVDFLLGLFIKFKK
ncbi:MAG TPA: CPBP family intramembrane glutamic endopeptidase [Pseudogracilibacillus sp.]|nr:CPBP family intramembrane glutamic endopeptidase [Pseudogracilibacillus sp.]